MNAVHALRGENCISEAQLAGQPVADDVNCIDIGAIGKRRRNLLDAIAISRDQDHLGAFGQALNNRVTVGDDGIDEENFGARLPSSCPQSRDQSVGVGLCGGLLLGGTGRRRGVILIRGRIVECCCNGGVKHDPRLKGARCEHAAKQRGSLAMRFGRETCCALSPTLLATRRSLSKGSPQPAKGTADIVSNHHGRPACRDASQGTANGRRKSCDQTPQPLRVFRRLRTPCIRIRVEAGLLQTGRNIRPAAACAGGEISKCCTRGALRRGREYGH